MYCGFLFGDYLTLSSMARSAAREAVIVGETVPKGHEMMIQSRSLLFKIWKISTQT